jgi:hypothetical protein
MAAVDDRGPGTARLGLRFTIGNCGLPRDNESLIRDFYFGRIDAALEKKGTYLPSLPLPT